MHLKNTKLSRLLGIMLLLKSREWISANEIADRFNVSLRTIYRDIATLQANDISIKGIPGPEGGYRLDSESPFPQILFASEEALGLYYLGAVRSDFPESIRHAGERAITSFAQTADPELVALLDRVVSRIHFDTTEWYWRDESTLLLPLLREALYQQRLIAFEYFERGSSLSVTIQLAPYGLVWKGGQWYIVGRSADGLIRRYRVSRLIHVQSLEQCFDYPADFNLRNWWEHELEEFGKGDIQVKLRVLPDAQEEFKKIAAKAMTRISFEENTMIITMNVDRWEWLIPLVLSFSPNVIVDEPHELRQGILESLRRGIILYQRDFQEQHESNSDRHKHVAHDDSRLRATRGRGEEGTPKGQK